MYKNIHINTGYKFCCIHNPLTITYKRNIEMSETLNCYVLNYEFSNALQIATFYIMGGDIRVGGRAIWIGYALHK
jgi:hypothetical protein